MDRRLEIVRPFLFAVGAAIALVAAGCSSAPEAGEADAGKASDIRALRWVAEGADKVAFLTTGPSACERPATSEAEASQRELGRIAFESPALLGGAAARMGLSCSSCHVNGRGNPEFFIESVSDKPGTADVTSSTFSRVRGDGAFNPVPIPDLVARDGKQIRDRKSVEFRAKVHGLVVEEFDGQDPPPEVFDALLAYLDGLDPSACVPWERDPIEPARDIDLARAAFDASNGVGLSVDARIFYLRAARLRLEQIHERFFGAQDAKLRERLVNLSRELGARAEIVRSINPGDPPRPELFLSPPWSELKLEIEKARRRSYYNPDVLRAALPE